MWIVKFNILNSLVYQNINLANGQKSIEYQLTRVDPNDLPPSATYNLDQRFFHIRECFWLWMKYIAKITNYIKCIKVQFWLGNSLQLWPIQGDCRSNGFQKIRLSRPSVPTTGQTTEGLGTPEPFVRAPQPLHFTCTKSCILWCRPAFLAVALTPWLPHIGQDGNGNPQRLNCEENTNSFSSTRFTPFISSDT